MTVDRLDEAIDQEVRRLMDAEPSGGLRARVLARIEEPASRRSAALWWMASAVAAAVVVVAVMLTRETPQAPQPAESIVASDGAAAAPPGTRPPGQLAPRVEATARTTAGRTARVLPHPTGPEDDGRFVQASSTDPATEMVSVSPLPGLEPIGVPAVTPSAMPLSDIAIAPVEIEGVRVDSMSSTPR